MSKIAEIDKRIDKINAKLQNELDLLVKNYGKEGQVKQATVETRVREIKSLMDEELRKIEDFKNMFNINISHYESLSNNIENLSERAYDIYNLFTLLLKQIPDDTSLKEQYIKSIGFIVASFAAGEREVSHE